MEFLNEKEGTRRIVRERNLKPHHPHHLDLKPLLNIDFKDDFEEMLTIFTDEDTVIAMISTLENSPEEIQIIAKMILDLHKKIDSFYGE